MKLSRVGWMGKQQVWRFMIAINIIIRNNKFEWNFNILAVIRGERFPINVYNLCLKTSLTKWRGFSGLFMNLSPEKMKLKKVLNPSRQCFRHSKPRHFLIKVPSMIEWMLTLERITKQILSWRKVCSVLLERHLRVHVIENIKLGNFCWLTS